jgi:hypothetical protein
LAGPHIGRPDKASCRVRYIYHSVKGKTMNRSFLIAALLAVGLTACGEKPATPPAQPAVPPPSTQPAPPVPSVPAPDAVKAEPAKDAAAPAAEAPKGGEMAKDAAKK